MIIEKTSVEGVLLLTPTVQRDARGSFISLLDNSVLSDHGFDIQVVRTAFSTNRLAGTLRGLHMQPPPGEERKLVTCIAGAACDVVIDVRRDSPTYRRHVMVELDAAAPATLAIPPGCAHGFITRSADTFMLYHLSVHHAPNRQVRIRWNDPGAAIPWPLSPSILSEPDRRCVDHVW